MSAHELRIELFVSGWDGRVRREHRRRAHVRERIRGRDGVFLDELAQPLELEERGVPLVHVEHRRRETELSQHAHTADPEHELLPDPVHAVAAVQRVRHVTRPVGVAADLRVEEVERDAPDLRLPDAEAYRHELAALIRELDHGCHRYELERQAARVVPRVALDLPVVLIKPLVEVAAPVEEADSDEWDAELRRRLQMVAGEDPETARIDWQALVEPELRAEVRDEEIVGSIESRPPRLGAAVAAEPALHALQLREIAGVEPALEVVVGQFREERGRARSDLGEPLRVELLEQRARLDDPREREVARDRGKRRAQSRPVVNLHHERQAIGAAVPSSP